MDPRLYEPNPTYRGSQAERKEKKKIIHQKIDGKLDLQSMQIAQGQKKEKLEVTF